MLSSGKNLPEYFIDGCAKAIIAPLAISLIGAIVRGGLYVDLEKRIMLKWKILLNDGTNFAVAVYFSSILITGARSILPILSQCMFHCA